MKKHCSTCGFEEVLTLSCKKCGALKPLPRFSKWEVKFTTLNVQYGILLDLLSKREDEIGLLKDSLITIKDSLSNVSNMTDRIKGIIEDVLFLGD